MCFKKFESLSVLRKGIPLGFWSTNRRSLGQGRPVSERLSNAIRSCFRIPASGARYPSQDPVDELAIRFNFNSDRRHLEGRRDPKI